MSYIIYSIFDRVSGQFYEPFLAVSEGIAVRRFLYLGAHSEMVKNDLQLFKLGFFNGESGVLDPLPKPEFVQDYFEENN